MIFYIKFWRENIEGTWICDTFGSVNHIYIYDENICDKACLKYVKVTFCQFFFQFLHIINKQNNA